LSHFNFKPKQPKFTQAEVEAIRRGYSRGISIRELGKLYQSDKNTIWHIVRRLGAYRDKTRVG
jgi:Mor family transcriptional regulator